MQLPPDLRAALDEALAQLPAGRLKTAAADLSLRYRAAAAAGRDPLLRSPQDVLAYLAVRLPATYAAVRAALQQIADALPDWRPATQLDAGAGPGTAAWAAAALWPGIGEVTLIERDREMIRIGRRLAAQAAAASLRQAEWLSADLSRLPAPVPHDLVTAAYVIGELDERAQDQLVSRLWQAARGALVLVEPGTPAGFARIRRARDALLAAGARLAAPCPHEGPCPMAAADWCHFAQRVERSALHRQAKGGELGHEDEKFSFVAVSHSPARPIAGRVIRHPQVRAGHVRLEICSPQGLRSDVVPRSQGERFRRVRDLRWGAELPDAPRDDPAR